MKDEPQELHEVRRLLSRLPEAPVPSNFTARVMQAVEREEARKSRSWSLFTWNWHALLPRAAAVAVMLVLASFTFRQYEISSQRAALVKTVAFLAQAQPPSMDVLQNFDAIQRMSQPAHADEGLLALAPDLK